MKVVVIGGVAGGMSTASKLKRTLKDKVDITVFEKGVEVSFGACGIPFYISDKIKTPEELMAKKAEEFLENGILVKDLHEVLSVDYKNKEVLVKNLKNGEKFIEKYDKLVIGSGARVKKFPPFDLEKDNLFQVRNVADGTKIKEQLKDENVKNIVIVGGGFIGIELVEACKFYNKNVTVIEAGNRILSAMDEEITDMLTEEIERNQVIVKTSTKVTDFIPVGEKINKIILDNGEQIDADIVINCAGITPNTEFIEGIEKDKNGAIIVNEKMETSIKDIYSAGDCSIMKSAITGQLMYAPLGTNANKQGRIISDVLSGVVPKPFKLIGSMAIKVFDLDAGKVGLSEQDAKNFEIDYKVNTITGNSYASYYGRKDKVTIKVIYDAKTRKILGAQTVGKGTVVPRANYYAIAVYSGLTVDEFGFLDLCYSPPFSGVWDVSLIASNTAR